MMAVWCLSRVSQGHGGDTKHGFIIEMGTQRMLLFLSVYSVFFLHGPHLDSDKFTISVIQSSKCLTYFYVLPRRSLNSNDIT